MPGRGANLCWCKCVVVIWPAPGVCWHPCASGQRPHHTALNARLSQHAPPADPRACARVRVHSANWPQQDGREGNRPFTAGLSPGLLMPYSHFGAAIMPHAAEVLFCVLHGVAVPSTPPSVELSTLASACGASTESYVPGERARTNCTAGCRLQCTAVGRGCHVAVGPATIRFRACATLATPPYIGCQ
jgi:hypothetical protein